MAQHEFVSHPLTVRRVQVLRTTEVTPRMRRVTLTGDQLGAFAVGGLDRPGFASPTFDDHVKLIFASDGDIASALPEQVPGGIEWGPSSTRQGRDYTPRRVDPVRREVDLDFVLHGHGPAASWARDAQPGDDLWFVGPKSSTVLPEGLDWIVLAGDETALPAIGRFLDERPVQVPAYIVVAVAADEARQELNLGPEDRIEWVVSDDAAAAAGLLTPAVRGLDLPPGAGQGSGYVWAAAESRALIPLRRYLQRDLGMPKSHLNITGYWHAEVPRTTPAGPPPAESAAPSPMDTESASAQCAPTAESLEPPVAWFAARAALQLGLIEAVADHPGASRGRLAGLLGVPEEPLGPLTAVLVDSGILTGDDSTLDLGPLGEELLVDDHLQGDLTGLEAELVLALDQLAPALRDPGTGASAWSRRHGASLWGGALASRDRYAELLAEGDILDYLLDVAVEDPFWTSVETAGISGPGAAAVVRALVRRDAHPALTVYEDCAGLEVLRAELAGREAVRFSTLTVTDPPVPADVLVGGLALAYRTDAEAVDFLRRAHQTAPSLVLVEASRPDGLDAQAREHALLSLAGTGTAHRGREAIVALAAGSGWSLDRVLPLGWGIEALFLTAGSDSPVSPDRIMSGESSVE
ncbi:siderophore-interacting protein [Citricoccus parietis]|uniref:Siderophore-interacting protein n=1 Tax=Citricoccus parietis TaxID=592307 RepID=A0ABV6F2Z9_9MICC